MSGQHPTYPHPLIQEALCEIHFELPEGNTWTPGLFWRLFDRVQDQFPEFEPVPHVAMRFHTGPSGIEQTLIGQQRVRYRHRERNLLLQLSEEVLTVNILPKYPGWQSMLADVLWAWQALTEEVHPTAIRRLGLRYINRIPKTAPNQMASPWLGPSNYLAPAALTSLPGFLSRLESQRDQDTRLIVTLADTDQQDADQAAIIFDIDCVRERVLGVESSILEQELSALHDTAWQVFAASMTPHLEKRLREGDT